MPTLTCDRCKQSFEGRLPTDQEIQAIRAKTGAPANVPTLVVCKSCIEKFSRQPQVQKVFSDTPAKFHSSKQLFQDEIFDQVKEIYTRLERFNIPYLTIFEVQWDGQSYSEYLNRLWVPNERRMENQPQTLMLINFLLNDEELQSRCFAALDQLNQERAAKK